VDCVRARNGRILNSIELAVKLVRSCHIHFVASVLLS